MNFYHQKELKNMTGNGSSELDQTDPHGLVEDEKILEVLLFASRNPMTIGDLKKSCPNIADIASSLTRLMQFYKDRGINLIKIKNAYAFRTAPRYGYLLKEYVEKRVKLSKAAKETLAIIAYNQPVTRSEIESIRGVSLYKGLLDSLLQTEWITLGPRRNAPGRPVTFITTNNFLDYFGLQAVKDMPNFQELNEVGLVGGKSNNALNLEQ